MPLERADVAAVERVRHAHVVVRPREAALVEALAGAVAGVNGKPPLDEGMRRDATTVVRQQSLENRREDLRGFDPQVGYCVETRALLQRR